MVLEGKEELIIKAILALVSILDICVNFMTRNSRERKSINMHFNACMIMYLVATIISAYDPYVNVLQSTGIEESDTNSAICYYFFATLRYIAVYSMDMTGIWTLLGFNKMLTSVINVFPKYQMNNWVYITIVYVCHIPYAILYVHETTCVASSCWIPSQYSMIIKILRPVIVYLILSLVLLILTAISLYRRKNIAVCGVKRNNKKTIMFFTIMMPTITMPIIIHVLWLTTDLMIFKQYQSYLGLSISFMHLIWSIYCRCNQGLFTNLAKNAGINKLLPDRFLNCTSTSATTTVADEGRV